ncbi:MAG: cytochrome c maturation protein CcmE [Sphingomonas sp.]|nr:cytochrome c maturation protein CcmE [Sphingomonas sp.]RZV51239.1 MAG: cytochrome c maturation protein CcmE [Sphingomonadaceae bacterium]
MKAKQQRLVLAFLAIGAVLLAAAFAIWGLQDRAAFFLTPQEVAAGKAEPGRAFRLGGMVSNGSLVREDDGISVRFEVEDVTGGPTVPVRYTGILPDLFREGQGVVAEGRLDAGGIFVADEILAKHDENYLPPSLARQHEAAETLEQ